MAFNKDDLIINMVLSGTMFDKKTRDVLFSLSMIEDPSLEIGGEKVYATDNYGMNIAAFNRAKTAKFSGSNSLFSLGLMANQLGTNKEIADSEHKLTVPKREIIQVGFKSGGTANTTVSLAYAPVAGSITIERLDDGKSLVGTTIPVEVSASSTAASVSDKVITLPTGMLAGTDWIGVYYEYETDSALKISNKSDAFTTAGEFHLEVLFAEKCNQAVQYYGYIVFPSAVLDNNATINLTTDGKHAFSIEAMTDYCSADKELFYIVVPDAA